MACDDVARGSTALGGFVRLGDCIWHLWRGLRCRRWRRLRCWCWHPRDGWCGRVRILHQGAVGRSATANKGGEDEREAKGVGDSHVGRVLLWLGCWCSCRCVVAVFRLSGALLHCSLSFAGPCVAFVSVGCGDGMVSIVCPPVGRMPEVYPRAHGRGNRE